MGFGLLAAWLGCGFGGFGVLGSATCDALTACARSVIACVESSVAAIRCVSSRRRIRTIEKISHTDDTDNTRMLPSQRMSKIAVKIAPADISRSHSAPPPLLGALYCSIRCMLVAAHHQGGWIDSWLCRCDDAWVIP